MGTLADLKARILNEMKRPSLTAECAKAVLDAIAKHSLNRFPWNEETDSSTVTVTGTASYALPDRFGRLIMAEVTVGAQRYELDEIDYETLRGRTRTAVGNATPPCKIAFFGGRFHLDPPPAGDGWTVDLTFTSQLTAMSDDTASNAWTNQAEPLIRAAAKRDLYHNVVRDYAEAQAQEAEEARWLGILQRRAEGHGRGRVAVPARW